MSRTRSARSSRRRCQPDGRADRDLTILGRHELAGRCVRPRDAYRCRALVHLARAVGLMPPPNAEFSDIRYVVGNAVAGVRYITGPGEDAGADAVRKSRPRRGTGGEGRGGASADACRDCRIEAAVRTHHRDRSE